MEALGALITGVGVLLLAIGEMWRRQNARLKKLENEKDLADKAVRTERDSLRQRVSDLEVKLQSQAGEIHSLRTQLNTVCRQLEENQARLESAEKRAENQQAEAERWREKAEELRTENDRLSARARELEIEVRTYRSALALVGEKVQQGVQAAGESAEPPDGSASEPPHEGEQKTDKTATKEQST
jgi:chromosome segregation ATPase